MKTIAVIESVAPRQSTSSLIHASDWSEKLLCEYEAIIIIFRISDI